MADNGSGGMALHDASALISPDTTQWCIAIPAAATKFVVGRKGHVVRQLQKESSTKIDVGRPGAGEEAALVKLTHPGMHLKSLVTATFLVLGRLKDTTRVSLQFPLIVIDDRIEGLLQDIAALPGVADGTIAFVTDTVERTYVNDAVVLTGDISTVSKVFFAVLERVLEIDAQRLSTRAAQARIVNEPGASSSGGGSAAGGSAASGSVSGGAFKWKMVVSGDSARVVIGKKGFKVAAIERATKTKVAATKGEGLAEIVISGNSVSAVAKGTSLALRELYNPQEQVSVRLPASHVDVEAVKALLADTTVPNETLGQRDAGGMALVVVQGLASHVQECMVLLIGSVVGPLTRGSDLGLVSYNLHDWVVGVAEDRVGAILGKRGATKATIEEMSSSTINIAAAGARATATVTDRDGDVLTLARGVYLLLTRLGDANASIQFPIVDSNDDDDDDDDDNDDGDGRRRRGPVGLSLTKRALAAVNSYVVDHDLSEVVEIASTADVCLVSGDADVVRGVFVELLKECVAFDVTDEVVGSDSQWQLIVPRRSVLSLAGRRYSALGPIQSAADCDLLLRHRRDEGVVFLTPHGAGAALASADMAKIGRALVLCVDRVVGAEWVAMRCPLDDGSNGADGNGDGGVRADAVRAAASGTEVEVTVQSGAIELRGPPAAAKEAIIDLFLAAWDADLSDLRKEWSATFPRSVAGRLIGKGGKKMRPLQKKYPGLDVSFSGGVVALGFDDESNPATMLAALYTTISSLGSDVGVVVRLPVRSGAAWDELSATVPGFRQLGSRSSDDDGSVELRGPCPTVALLLVHLARRAYDTDLVIGSAEGSDTSGGRQSGRQDAAGGLTWLLTCQQSAFGAIVGRSGRHINDVTKTFGVGVRTRKKGKKAMATITGGETLSVAKASMAMLNRLDAGDEVSLAFEAAACVLLPPQAASTAAWFEGVTESDPELATVASLVDKLDSATSATAAADDDGSDNGTDDATDDDGDVTHGSDGAGGDDGDAGLGPIVSECVRLSGSSAAVQRGLATLLQAGGHDDLSTELAALHRVTWNIVIPASAIGHVIGHRGSVIEEIKNSSGAVVNVRRNRPTPEQATVDIEGRFAAVVNAALLVFQHTGDGEFLLTLPMIGAWSPAVEEKLEALANPKTLVSSSTSGVVVGLDYTPTEIRLEGTPLAIENSLMAVLNKAFGVDTDEFSLALLGSENRQQWRLEVPRTFAGRVAGKGARNKRRMELLSGASIGVRYKKKTIVVVFSLEGAEGASPDDELSELEVGRLSKALRMVLDVVSENTDLVLTMPLPRSVVSWAVSPRGGGGSNGPITGVGRADGNVVVLEGSPGPVWTAVAALAGHMNASMPPTAVSTEASDWEMSVPESCVGLILGKGGRNKLDIQQTSGVVVEVYPHTLTANVSYKRDNALKAGDASSNDDDGDGDAADADPDFVSLMTAVVCTLDKLAAEPEDVAVEFQLASRAEGMFARAIEALLEVAGGGAVLVVEAGCAAVCAPRSVVREALINALVAVGASEAAGALQAQTRVWQLSVDRSAYLALVSSSSAAVKRIQEATGVELNIRSRGTDGAVITIPASGDVGPVAQAMVSVLGAIDPASQVNLSCPEPEGGAGGGLVPMGKSRESTSSNAVFEGGRVVIDGNVQEVCNTLYFVYGGRLGISPADMKSSLIRLVSQDVSTWAVRIPGDRAGVVIGKAGKKLKSIRSKTGVHVRVDAPGRSGRGRGSSSSRTQVASGEADIRLVTFDVSKAKAGVKSVMQAVASVLGNVNDGDEVVLQLPLDAGVAEDLSADEAQASLELVATMSAATSASAFGSGPAAIEVTKEVALFSGGAQQVLVAVLKAGRDVFGADTAALLDTVKNKHKRWTLTVPSDSVGYVVGKKGAQINAMQALVGRVEIFRMEGAAEVSFGNAKTDLFAGLDAIVPVLNRLNSRVLVEVGFPLSVPELEAAGVGRLCARMRITKPPERRRRSDDWGDNGPGGRGGGGGGGQSAEEWSREQVEDLVLHDVHAEMVAVRGEARLVALALETIAADMAGDLAAKSLLRLHWRQLEALTKDAIERIQEDTGATATVGNYTDRDQWVRATVSASDGASVLAAIRAMEAITEDSIIVIADSCGTPVMAAGASSAAAVAGGEAPPPGLGDGSGNDATGAAAVADDGDALSVSSSSLNRSGPVGGIDGLVAAEAGGPLVSGSRRDDGDDDGDDSDGSLGDVPAQDTSSSESSGDGSGRLLGDEVAAFDGSSDVHFVAAPEEASSSPEAHQAALLEFLDSRATPEYVETPHIMLVPFEGLLERLSPSDETLAWLNTTIFAKLQEMSVRHPELVAGMLAWTQTLSTAVLNYKQQRA